MKYRIKNTRLTVLILAYYQIIGGIIGLWVLVKILMNSQTINGALLLIILIALGLYYFSIKSGSLLIRQEYKRGLIYSMIHQSVQVIGIGFGGDKFLYYSGANIGLGPNFTDGIEFKFLLEFFSEFEMSLNLSEKSYFLYVNILAMFLLYVFWDLYKELILDEMKESTSPIEKTEIDEGFVI